jgi:hypothetical protein
LGQGLGRTQRGGPTFDAEDDAIVAQEEDIPFLVERKHFGGSPPGDTKTRLAGQADTAYVQARILVAGNTSGRHQRAPERLF